MLVIFGRNFKKNFVYFLSIQNCRWSNFLEIYFWEGGGACMAFMNSYPRNIQKTNIGANYREQIIIKVKVRSIIHKSHVLASHRMTFIHSALSIIHKSHVLASHRMTFIHNSLSARRGIQEHPSLPTYMMNKFNRGPFKFWVSLFGIKGPYHFSQIY